MARFLYTRPLAGMQPQCVTRVTCMDHVHTGISEPLKNGSKIPSSTDF
jgi:hypothetical protein